MKINLIKNKITKNNSNQVPLQLIVEGIENLERGLKILGENIDFGEIRLPLLGIDVVGRLVILEVFEKEDETILLKVIDDFDWVFNHTDQVRQRFGNFAIDISLSPRVIIVLPRFSPDLLRRISYLGQMELQLYLYRLINHASSQSINFELVSFSSQRKFIKDLEEKSVDDLLNYIENPLVKTVCQKILGQIKQLFPRGSIVSSSGYISIQSKDKELFGIYPQRDFFWFNFSKNVWQGIYVNSPSQIEGILNEIKSISRNK